jgi:hypothetical protein
MLEQPTKLLGALNVEGIAAIEPIFGTDAETGVSVFRNPEVERLQAMIAAARARLAESEADYTKERIVVENLQAQIFRLVRNEYQARDRLKLIIDYRKKFIDTLLRQGDEEAEQIASEYQKAREETDANYDKAAADAARARKLSKEDEEELNSLWKKLVRLFHPDRYANDPTKKTTYENLTADINRARDEGDIERLREIADDSAAFIARQGWAVLGSDEEIQVNNLHKHYAALQVEIVKVLERLSELRESPEYELLTLSKGDARFIEDVANRQKQALAEEIETLEAEAARLNDEIEALTGAEADAIL